MASNFDDSLSSLLCNEDITVFDDEQYDDSSNPKRQHYGDVHDVLPLQSEECLILMLEKECQQYPGVDYMNKLKFGDLDCDARNEAIDWIQKVQAHFGFGPLCVYLSINYMDRFLSTYEFPKEIDWTMQLLAVTCLSLAAKIDEIDVPKILDLQIRESKFMFEAKTIKKMEILVLSTLKWRMQAITPFSFIEYFLSKINHDESLSSDLISQCTQLILRTIKGIDFLEFKPSEIAAAVVTCVVGERETQAIDKLIQYIEKERLLKCVEKVQEFSLKSVYTKDSNAYVPCLPLSISYAKRRKLNKTCGEELL